MQSRSFSYGNGHSYSFLYLQSESEEQILPQPRAITKIATAKWVIHHPHDTTRNMEIVPYLQPHKSVSLLYC